ncbi:glycosyltransferase [Chryseobacterium sp. 1B4]
MKLSVIIVNYNVTQLLRRCLLSLQKYIREVEYEIIVIDNASTDPSWQELITEFPDIHFISSETNGGFSKANNQAIQTAKGEYILLLNPDTEFEGFYMKELLDFADAQPSFGCLGVRMHDAEGNFCLKVSAQFRICSIRLKNCLPILKRTIQNPITETI